MTQASTTIEQHIQAARADVAPRILPEDIEANIVSEHYFTADQGAEHEAYAQGLETVPRPDCLKLLTLCVLVLRNGFTVVGKSACASPENFNAEKGRVLARADAVRQIWPLMGYELRSKLTTQPTTFQQRVCSEFKELGDRIDKLQAFTRTETFGDLPVAEQECMLAQLAAMTDYSACLAERIQAFGGAQGEPL